MASTLKYPVGIQDFEKLRNMGYVYADKTQYLMKMLESPAYYFLSRPRRFGKSLFLTTLEAYFKGKRELFKGLAIDRDETDWTPRPVIKLSLNGIEATSEESLYDHIGSTFAQYERSYGITPKVKSLSVRFEDIIRTAYEQTDRKVVILIDEYDSPLLSTLENGKLNNSYRDTLKSVFTILKRADAHIHMAFITGVSRFSQTSLFSGTNHLEDISLDKNYSAICGITEGELKSVFRPGISNFATSLGISDEMMLGMLKENYDGYHFSKRSEDIYNPFSLLLALKKQEISNYWFESGTPSYLILALQRDNFYLPDLDCMETVESSLSARESYMQNPVALLYEAGYVTIKGYDNETEVFTLGLPNREVSTSFAEALLPIYSGWDPEYSKHSFVQMRKAVYSGDAESFMRHLQTFLEGNPYSNSELAKREKYFKTNVFLVLKALGFRPHTEEETCMSRIDVMLRTRRFIYIFELKTDGDSRKAIDQIEARGYTLPYADEGRRLIRIGASYDSIRNNIGDWVIRQ